MERMMGEEIQLGSKVRSDQMLKQQDVKARPLNNRTSPYCPPEWVLLSI